MPTLSLPETLLLLGFDAQNATTRYALSMSYALAGAQLHELVLAGRVHVQSDRVVRVDAAPTGDPQLDEVLAKIAKGDRPRASRHWVMKRKSNAVALYARRLVDAGVLSSRRTRVLGIVPRTVFPIVDEALRARALEEVAAALADPAPPPERTRALIALVHVTAPARTLLGDRQQRERAKQIASDDVIARAVKSAIDGVNAAYVGNER
ncbi:MAG: GOLPH3/VPS74 family protein [Solirubrobacteraceae bacterium]